jgi:hypothetical protein
MAKSRVSPLQGYPRRNHSYLADDSLFQPPKTPLSQSQLDGAIKRAFERSLLSKSGDVAKLPHTPEELVSLCIRHLRERSDPVLSPSFLSQCRVEEIFELDAVSHEMQRQRMKIGVFYQYLVIELMRYRFPATVDGKREGDVESDIDTPGFTKGLRLYMSVKKSGDTVGGQDVSGMISRIEEMAKEDKNLTRPYLGVVCVATPPRGKILSYEKARTIKHNREGHPYSPNCEVWTPGFIFPYISGVPATEIYKRGLEKVGEYLPFHALAQREGCAVLLASQLKDLNLVDINTGRINPEKFQTWITQTAKGKGKQDDDLSEQTDTE